MPDFYGFEVLGDSGLVQLSDKAFDLTWQNVATLNGTGDFSGDFLAVEPQQGQTFYPIMLDMPIVSSGPPYPQQNPDKLQRYGGQGRVHYFGYDKGTAGENYGLQVFNDAGEVTFSSNRLSIDILESVYIYDIREDLKANNNQYITRIYVGDKKAAVILTGMPLLLEKNSRNHFDGYSVSFSREGSYITVRYFKFKESFMPSFLGFRYTSRASLQFLVIDLKGF